MEGTTSIFSYEDILIHMLVNNQTFRGSILPHLEESFFTDGSVEKLVFQEIQRQVKKNITNINYIQLWLGLEQYIGDNEELREKVINKFTLLEDNAEKIENSVDIDSFIEQTERFAQQKALRNAIFTAADILQENDPIKVQSLPSIFSDALNIHVDRNVGTDVSTSVVERYWKRKDRANRIPFIIKRLNQITKGGFPRKSLSGFILPTGGGKTTILVSLAADYLRQGYGVLYVTLELSEDIISTRIDANITNTSLDELERIEIQEYVKRCEEGYAGKGRIIVREFPTSSVTTNALHGLIAELKQKQNFTPDVLIVDYINLINPARLNNNYNSYQAIKAAAEEIRGVCVRYDMVGITATQVNRDGIKSGEIELTDTSESIGLPFTLDFMCGGIQTEEQRAQNIVIMKVMKNRWSGFVNTKFALNLDFNLMRLSDLSVEEEKHMEKNGVNSIRRNESVTSESIRQQFKPFR